jgi:hypothetical protein
MTIDVNYGSRFVYRPARHEPRLAERLGTLVETALRRFRRLDREARP